MTLDEAKAAAADKSIKDVSEVFMQGLRAAEHNGDTLTAVRYADVLISLDRATALFAGILLTQNESDQEQPQE